MKIATSAALALLLGFVVAPFPAQSADRDRFRTASRWSAPRLALWVNGGQMRNVQEPKHDMIVGMADGGIALQFHVLTSIGPSSMVMPLSYNTPGVSLGFRNMAIREIRSGEALPPIAPPEERPAGFRVVRDAQ